MSAPRRNRKLLAHFEEMKRHVGHTVQFYSKGTDQNWAKVLRVTLREDIHGVLFWIESKPFPDWLGSDQIRDCDCLKK